MLNTLIHNQPVNKGLQWGIYIATLEDGLKSRSGKSTSSDIHADLFARKVLQGVLRTPIAHSLRSTAAALIESVLSAEAGLRRHYVRTGTSLVEQGGNLCELLL